MVNELLIDIHALHEVNIMFGKGLFFVCGLSVALTGALLMSIGYAVPGVALLALGLSAIKVTLPKD